MRKLLAGLVAVLSLSLVTAQLSVAAVTPGTKCYKSGATSTYNGKKYTCVKSGKKLVWNKGVALPKPKPVATPTPSPSPTPTQTVQPIPPIPSTMSSPEPFTFNDLCSLDPDVPVEWKGVQEWSIQYMGCARPYRYVESNLTDKTPITPLTSKDNYGSIESCKVRYVGPWPYENLGFQGDSSNRYRPTKSANIQVIPVQFSDATSRTIPRNDYGKYLKFVSEFLKNVSDVPIETRINYLEEYIDLGKPIAAYNLNDEHGDMTLFQNDVISKSDPFINFAGVDQIIIVGPPNLNGSFTYHMNWKKPWRTSEGVVKSAYQIGSISLTPKVGSVWSPDPWITVHEAVGHQLGMMDLLGSVDPGRKKVWEYSGRDLGSGFWGQMSGAYGDFLIWQKWIVGFLFDEQVACLQSNTLGTHWIRPSEIKGNYLKSVMIPLNDKKLIVIESVRSVGYNYKMRKSAQGALVYLVDVNETKNDFGVYLKLPDGRNSSIGASRIDGTLRIGDSIVVEGYKISVVESGDFGDVVKVEKA
jgi:hypothetical protein